MGDSFFARLHATYGMQSVEELATRYNIDPGVVALATMDFGLDVAEDIAKGVGVAANELRVAKYQEACEARKALLAKTATEDAEAWTKEHAPESVLRVFTEGSPALVSTVRGFLGNLAADRRHHIIGRYDV